MRQCMAWKSHHFVGLFDGVVTVDILGIIEVLGALATQPHDATTRGNHCLRQIVVQVRFWIGV